VSRKQKQTPPPDRAAIVEQLRQLAADHFDCGLVVLSWEEGGETFHMETHFGNRYAVESLSEKTTELLFPFEDDEEDEEAEA
jgi:acyl-CoA reductase-like NAD-dependent aldehyde dehydrogenase